MSEPACEEQPETMCAAEVDTSAVDVQTGQVPAVATAYSAAPDEPDAGDPPTVEARMPWWRAELIAAAILAAAVAIIAAILFVPSINDSPAGVVSLPSVSQVVPAPPTVTVTQAPADPAPEAVPSPTTVAAPPVAPPKAPPPSVSREQQLAADLDARGFDSDNPAGTAAAARQACSYLAGGASFSDVVDALHRESASMSWDQEASVLNAMVAVYCPQYG